MLNGFYDIHPNFSDNYLDVMTGKVALNTKAIEVRSEMFDGDETESDEATTPEKILNSIVIIRIEGPIQRNNILNRNAEVAVYGMDWVSYAIAMAANDPKNVALVLEFQTGGGASNAVAPVIEALKNYKALGRKVYASVDVACSAGYHIAVFCDKIYANSRSAIMGCIGTKWEGYDDSETNKKYGIKEISVFAETSPDKNKEFLEALKGKPELLKSHLVNPMGKHFLDDVVANRPGIDSEIIKGSTVAAELAVQAKMCDGIMSITDIIKGIIKKEMPKTSQDTSTNSFTNKIKTNMSLMEMLGLKSEAPDEIQKHPEFIQVKSAVDGLSSTVATQLTQIGNQATEIGNLKSQLDAEKTAKNTVESELAALKLQNDANIAKLEALPGAAPKTAVLNATGELIENGSRYDDPEIQNEINDILAQAKAKRDRMTGL